MYYMYISCSPYAARGTFELLDAIVDGEAPALPKVVYTTFLVLFTNCYTSTIYKLLDAIVDGEGSVHTYTLPPPLLY